MVFTPDTELALQAAVDLVNTAPTRPDGEDALVTVADFDRIWTEYRYTGRHDRTRAELDGIRALRPRLRAVLTSAGDEAVELVNAMLAEARAVPQLRRHDDLDWHIHAVDSDAPLTTRIQVETALGMVDVIRAGEMSRLGLCADDGCTGVVLDLSRNRSRRFCSVTCGNRNAVAAYRARQADSDQADSDQSDG